MKSLFLFSLLLVGVFCDWVEQDFELCESNFECGEGNYCEIFCPYRGPCLPGYCTTRSCPEENQIYRCESEDYRTCDCVCKAGYFSVLGRCLRYIEH